MCNKSVPEDNQFAELQMAMVAKVLMVVLAFGCATVMNQSTTCDHDDKSLIRILPHLEMLITKLEGKMMLEMAGLEQQLISRFRQLRNMTEFRGVGKYNICSLIARIAAPGRKDNFEGEKRADKEHNAWTFSRPIYSS